MRKYVCIAIAWFVGCLTVCGQKTTVSILGDSYSTFEGYLTPDTLGTWYYANKPDVKRTDVCSVEETWWWQVIDLMGWQLEANNSYSGATICNTGYHGKDRTFKSFVTRMNNLGHPDVIFIFGGTNDDWANSPIGKYKYNDISRSDLFQFRPAMAYLLCKVQELYPKASVYFISNSDQKPVISESIETICRHYQVPLIQLKGIDKRSGHPTVKGMRQIAQQVIDQLELWPNGTPIGAWFRDTCKVDITSLGKRFDITDYGVNNDSTTIQTEAFQRIIDRCSEEGGGVIVVPKGTFLTGALFFKKGTHLHIEDSGKIKGIDDIRHYPLIPMHMEGLPVSYFAALITAEHVDGFTITGRGTIDGNARRFWDEFWIRRRWNRKCTNQEALRPQLVYISHADNVTIQDVRLVNSAYWTSHLYCCNRVRYLDCHIESPTEGDTRAPSSDAIDLDVCNDVQVCGCYINICDDGVCLKGGKGTFVDRDSTAGAVNRVLVEDCRFGKYTNAGVTFGSEAWNCHNIIMRNCQFEDSDHMLLFKMRPDTPQWYGDVLVENCSGTISNAAFEASTWTQFHDLNERPDMPVSSVRNVTIRNIDVKASQFFHVRMKHPFTLSRFTLENIEAIDSSDCFETDSIQQLTIKNVKLNQQIIK